MEFVISSADISNGILSAAGIMIMYVGKKVLSFISAYNHGVVALLRDRILQSSRYFLEKGEIPITAKANMTAMYAAYHTLGGNDIATEWFQRAMDLTISEIDGV